MQHRMVETGGCGRRGLTFEELAREPRGTASAFRGAFGWSGVLMRTVRPSVEALVSRQKLDNGGFQRPKDQVQACAAYGTLIRNNVWPHVACDTLFG